ncbi:hypothetical protein GOODEAATRI_011471, partial [Goodea atripinnis]
LWRIEDVMGGLSVSKTNYKITVDSIQNPADRRLVPSVTDQAVPSHSTEVQPPPRSSISHTLPHSIVPKWAEDNAPPRPPLPRLYDYEETPPVVPPLPKEASVIRHTSVRGLKRQSDERKRDRECGHYVANGDCKDRPKSAFERLLSPTEGGQLPSSQPRGRMTAEEQLERMKRHQRALVRERKRNLSHGDRSCTGLSTSQRSSSSSRLPSSPSDPNSSVRYPSLHRSSSRHREHQLHPQCCYATLHPPAT